MEHIKNKTLIITGASQGIGEATARLFAKLGANVALIARSKEKIEKSIRNIPNIKVTDINHFSAFDIVKFKKVVFTESSVKELEKRYS